MSLEFVKLPTEYILDMDNFVDVYNIFLLMVRVKLF